MQITFITNQISQLKKDDSTMQILRECVNRKHKAFLLEKDSISCKNGIIYGQTYVGIEALNYFSNQKIPIIQTRDLAKNDIIAMRQDPPFDEDYIYITYLLELLKDKIFIFNDPVGVRNANEKMFILKFPQYIPPTLVTRSAQEIKNFLKQFPDGIVIKPLNNKGGTGVFYLQQHDVNKNEIIKIATDNGQKFLMAQKFLKAIKKTGDKRITILNGQVINAFIRIPHQEDFRGNVCSGAIAQKTKITKKDLEIVKIIAPILKKMGLYLVGLDLIDGYLTEINSTSPVIGNTMYPQTAPKIVDFLESQAKFAIPN